MFAEPQELSPKREFDHAITLNLEGVAVNVRPYCHSYQKNEIERQVQKILDDSIIQFSRSHSP